MAYVPPHKRLQDGSSSFRPTPVAPPSRRQSRDKHGKPGGRNDVFKPDIDIKCSRNIIRRWFAVDEIGDPSRLVLQFKPFLGESFEHLRDERLYTLDVVPPVTGEFEVENNLHSLTLTVVEPWRFICERLRSDLHNAFLNVHKYLEMSKPSPMKPTFMARFGKILFHSDGLAWHENTCPDIVEKTLQGEKGFLPALKKTFDTSICKNIFEALKERTMAKLDTEKLTEKENYLIQVEDNMRPHVILRCTCVKKNSNDTEQLELKKIKMDPVRHFVADISLLNKCFDLRLILFTEEFLMELSEEERVCIEGIVRSACIEESAKGGLHWPLGGDHVSGRFRVKGAWHRNKTTIIGKTWKLKLRCVNRTEFKASSGGVSYEVQLKLTKLTGYLRDQMQWDEDNILGILEETVKWIWTECL